MTRFFVLLSVCLFISANLHAQSRADEEQELRSIMEVQWTQAYQSQDTKTLDHLLAEEYQMIDASGNVFKKNDELKYLKDFKPTYDSFEFNTSRADIFENKTAVIAGLGVIKGQDLEGKYQTIYHSSNVFIKRGAEWQAISSHVSGIQKQYFDKN